MQMKNASSNRMRSLRSTWNPRCCRCKMHSAAERDPGDLQQTLDAKCISSRSAHALVTPTILDHADAKLCIGAEKKRSNCDHHATCIKQKSSHAWSSLVSKENLEPILQHAKPRTMMHDQNKNLWKLETQNLALIRDCQLQIESFLSKLS